MTNPLTAEYPQADLSDLTHVNIMGDHLLLRMYPQAGVTPGGIELPEGSQEKRTAAWVIGIGKGLEGGDYHLGDTVSCTTSSLWNVLPEMAGDGSIRYVLARDVVVHWPTGGVV